MQSYQGVRFAAVVPGGQWVSALSSSVRGVGTWVKHTWGNGVRGLGQLVAGVHGLLRPASDVGSRSIAMVVAADGTPVFDDNDRPGNDSSDHNGVVRVNDLVTYRVDYMVSGVHSENTTVVITLPKGLMLESLPAFCGRDSSLIPSVVASPPLPYSSYSINELPEQSLSCNIGSKENVAEGFALSVKVSNTVHNDMTLKPVSVTMKGDGLSEISATNVPSVKASSALKWNISKNGLTGRPVSWPAEVVADCPDNSGRKCFAAYFPVHISAPVNGKGSMPATGNVTFIDDVSPRKFYTNLTESQYVQIEANKAKYGAMVVRAGAGADQPNSQLNAPDQASWSVRYSGSMNIEQNVAGTPAKVTLEGTDWSLTTIPTETWDHHPIPAGNGYAVALSIITYIPVETVRDFGIHSNGVWTLPVKNTFTNLSIPGFTEKDIETSTDQPQNDDENTSVCRIYEEGNFDNRFFGVTGVRENESRYQYSFHDPAFGEGLPNNTNMAGDGLGWVGPKQEVISQFNFGGSSPALPVKETHLACAAWDNNKSQLTGIETKSVPNTYNAFASNKRPVWLSGYRQDKRMGSTEVTAPRLLVQYGNSYVPTSGADSNCMQNAGVTWYNSPEQVPGNDPVKLNSQHPVYTAVNRVRLFLVIPEIGQVVIGLGLTTTENLSQGTIVPTWASDMWATGALSIEDLVSSTNKHLILSGYDPQTHSGAPGDRLNIVLSHLEVNSGGRNMERTPSGSFESSVKATGDEHVQFQIHPSITGGNSLEQHELWIEDCLPAVLEYEMPDRSDSTTLIPNVVSSSMPPDAKRPACGPGETYIRWEFTHLHAGDKIPDVLFTARVSKTAPDGSYVNSVVTWSDADPAHNATHDTSVSVRIDNIAGVAVDKRSLTPTVGVNRVGSAVLESNVWELSVRNSQPTSGGLSDVVLVDVLPVAGVAGSRFTGVALLRSVSVTRGGSSGVRVEYTVSADVPRDPRVGEPGSVRWCVEAEFGSVGCPVSVADSRAVRVSRAGVFASGEVLAARVVVDVVGDVAGDVVVNQGYARVGGLRDPVGPVSREQRVVGASVAGVVWWDMDSSGVRDAGEPVAAGVPVVVTGVDDLGNPVRVSTHTGSDGGYRLDGLRACAGVCVLRVDGSSSVGFTARARGVDRARDSDVDADGRVELAVGVGDSVRADAGLLAGVVGWRKTSVGGQRLAGSRWRVRDRSGRPVVDVLGGSLAVVDDCVGVCQAAGVDRDVSVGGFELVGLPAGSYVLQEVVAPAGYVLVGREFVFTVDREHPRVDVGQIVNQQQQVPSLPLTGGVSVVLVVMVGCSCVLAGLLVGVSRARRLLAVVLRGRHRA
ncbi:SdrD B-like domain-containing protein [Bombiscardovia coagulans]|uniref:Uncharacterized protein n=1 Tax=Bombiscardovia coagulans TaxID=686666 RepID=A0A261ER15_9BIFI|nr:SdrD B-like domain-containing protein [Bombiscardovia coagulans]OZG49298.1 hypothetical protein BOCO_1107 [Bombiscardovia coagulans]